jgi:hypothetical protein
MPAPFSPVDSLFPVGLVQDGRFLHGTVADVDLATGELALKHHQSGTTYQFLCAGRPWVLIDGRPALFAELGPGLTVDVYYCGDLNAGGALTPTMICGSSVQDLPGGGYVGPGAPPTSKP